MAVEVAELPSAALIADIVIGVAAITFLLIVAVAWATSTSDAAQSDAEKRRVGREAVSSQGTLSLTASSIFLAASFVILQIGHTGDNDIADSAETQVLMAAIAFAASALLTVWNSAVATTLSIDLDVSLNPMTNIISATALFSLFAGAGFFTVGLFLL